MSPSPAVPLLQRFADFIATSAILISNFIHVQRETGALGRFFKTAGDSAAQLWRIARDLVIAIFNIGKAAYPAGKTLLDSFEGVTKKWADWTGSMKGQNTLRATSSTPCRSCTNSGAWSTTSCSTSSTWGMNDALAGLVSQIRTQACPRSRRSRTTCKGAFGQSLVQAIGDVINLLADLTGAGGDGYLTTFVDTLDTIVNDIDALIKMPGVGPVIGFLFSLAGGVAAVGLVLGPAIKGLTIMAGALDAIAVGTGLAAEGFTVMGLAMDVAMGPVGWIIGAITLLSIAFYELYQHNETFRNAMNGLWAEIKREALILWNDILAIGHALAPFARAVGGFFAQVGRNIGQMFSNLASMVKGAWSYITNTLGGIGKASGNLKTMIGSRRQGHRRLLLRPGQQDQQLVESERLPDFQQHAQRMEHPSQQLRRRR
jgi:hypothetical protein